jgi:hypothetical protein
MLRRTALAAILAPLAASVLPAAGLDLVPVPDTPTQRQLITMWLLPDKQQNPAILYFRKPTPRLIVRYEARTPEAVVDSMKAGLSAGWPDWETHTNGGGRAQMDHFAATLQAESRLTLSSDSSEVQSSVAYSGMFLHQTAEDIRKTIVDLTDCYDVLLAGDGWDRITRQWKVQSRRVLRTQDR